MVTREHVKRAVKCTRQICHSLPAPIDTHISSKSARSIILIGDSLEIQGGIGAVVAARLATAANLQATR